MINWENRVDMDTKATSTSDLSTVCEASTSTSDLVCHIIAMSEDDIIVTSLHSGLSHALLLSDRFDEYYNGDGHGTGLYVDSDGEVFYDTVQDM